MGSLGLASFHHGSSPRIELKRCGIRHTCTLTSNHAEQFICDVSSALPGIFKWGRTCTSNTSRSTCQWVPDGSHFGLTLLAKLFSCTASSLLGLGFFPPALALGLGCGFALALGFLEGGLFFCGVASAASTFARLHLAGSVFLRALSGSSRLTPFLAGVTGASSSLPPPWHVPRPAAFAFWPRPRPLPHPRPFGGALDAALLFAPRPLLFFWPPFPRPLPLPRPFPRPLPPFLPLPFPRPFLALGAFSMEGSSSPSFSTSSVVLYCSQRSIESYRLELMKDRIHHSFHMSRMQLTTLPGTEAH